MRPCTMLRKREPPDRRTAGPGPRHGGGGRRSGACRRSPSSWSAGGSPTSGRPVRCCCSPTSMCSGWRGCGSRPRRRCSRRGGALAAFAHPVLLLAGVGVGLCSSVIPYVTDQLAMARLPRATFALMLALLPMLGTSIGAIVLGQVPTGQDLLGIALVVVGVALHKIPADEGLHRNAAA